MWYSAIQQELKRSRVLSNLHGRKHRFLDRWGDSLFRSAYSYIPQSTVGDLLNKALKRLYDSLLELPYDMTILLQLHDALYVEVEEKNVDAAVKHLRKMMLISMKYGNEEFTIDIDFKCKTSWAEGEELEINWRNEE
jgi:DNA polymerase I-like protein with 3'-5' exonuclease and polymerase domains